MITVDKEFHNWFGEFHKKRWQTRNGIKLSSKGYILIHYPDHPRCNNHGYVMEHRIVWENYHGRFLSPEEEIHHINGVKTDNRIENLQLLSKSEHTKLHHCLT